MVERDEAEQQPTPKPFRPRDELGRPLPAGSEDRLRLPDFDAQSLEQNHEDALRYFAEARYFHAHEAWETCWGQAKDTADEPLFKGLAQLGAGYTHYLRGNAHGAGALLGRAIDNVEIGREAAPRYGVDADALLAVARATAAVAEGCERRGEPLPPLDGPGVASWAAYRADGASAESGDAQP